MQDNAISAYAGDDEEARELALEIKPLPWRYCALLIFLGSLGCYALGYAMFLAFARLLATL